MTIPLTEGGRIVCFIGEKSPAMKNLVKTPVRQSGDDLEEEVAGDTAAEQGPR